MPAESRKDGPSPVNPAAQEHVMGLVFGRWRSQILYAGVALGVFDALGEKPRPAGEVLGELGLHPGLGYRLMRALGALGLLRETPDRSFALTEAGALLQARHPQTLRGVTLLEEGPEHYALWKHLPAMVREGRQNAFQREFGRHAFEHAAEDPAYAEVFNSAMSSYSSAQSAWVLEGLADYDFSGIGTLCDIGGGRGHLLCSLLARHSRLRGVVLERPEVIADPTLLWATRMGVADRCVYVRGDMFAAVPPAEAYIMKMILHDWNDEECVRILTNARREGSARARMLIVEHLVTPPDTPHFSKLFDIHMMCWGTGRERTAEEYRALLERAGWTYVATHPTPGLMGIVEGMKGA